MPLHKVLSVCYLHAEPRLFGYKYKRDEKIFNGGGCHSVYAGSILHQGRSAAVQGQLHLTIPVTDEGSLLETVYPVASVTVSGETLTLTSDNASKEVTVYAKEEIPAEVKDGAVEVKSAETARTSPWL